MDTRVKLLGYVANVEHMQELLTGTMKNTTQTGNDITTTQDTTIISMYILRLLY